MRHSTEDHLPEDLSDIAQRLRGHRSEADALELDRMKMRAMARATSSRSKGSALRSRLVVALLTLGLMAGGTGGVIAKNNKAPKGNAAKTNYGKKCGHPGGGPKKPNQSPCPPSSPAGGGGPKKPTKN